MIFKKTQFEKQSNIKYKNTSSPFIFVLDGWIYLKDGPFKSDIGIVNLHPSKGTHCVLYINGNYFVSYGCAPPKKLSKFIIRRNGYCLFSEYQMKKNDSYCAGYCLYIPYLTKVIGIDFKSAVLSLYYQMIN